MQNSSGGCLSDIYILSWSFLYAHYGQKWWYLNKIQYFSQSTIKVVTKVFLKVSALPLIENLIEEKQKFFVAVHQTRRWTVSVKDLLVFFPSYQKSNGFLKQRITNLTLRKRWELAPQKVTYDWKPGLTFWPASTFLNEEKNYGAPPDRLRAKW